MTDIVMQSLAWFGGFVFFVMRLDKRLYDVIEGTAVDWKPYVALFRRRNPKAADVLDKFRIADKDKDELSSDA